MEKLGFGLMRLPLLDPEDQKNIDIEQLKKMVDLFLERGFTYFDTVYIYHGCESERAIKAALVDRYPRRSFTLTDKLPTMRLNAPGDAGFSFRDSPELLDKILAAHPEVEYVQLQINYLKKVSSLFEA